MSFGKLHRAEGGLRTFWCPACGCAHWIDPQRWTVSGTDEAPTLSPSVLVTTGHYIAGHRGDTCYCTWNVEHPDDRMPPCTRCHLYVRDGRIEYLSDCTHPLAGKTVPMESF